MALWLHSHSIRTLELEIPGSELTRIPDPRGPDPSPGQADPESGYEI